MRCRALVALGALAGALVMAASGPAAAQADPTKVEANRKLAEARKLYEAGDFEGALRKLKLAYDIIPSPKIQFSLGQAYRGLGRHVEALDAYNKFLVEAKDADPALRREAEQYMKDLTERVSFVEIACDVVGADVAIDGRSYGPTPMPGPIVVTPGPHQIVIQRPGGATPFIERIEPHRTAVVRVNARLAEQPAQAPTPPPPPPPAPVSAAASVPPAPHQTVVTSDAGNGVDLKRAPASTSATPIYVRWWFWASLLAVSAAAVTIVVLNGHRGELRIDRSDFGDNRVSLK